jgi:hypothetical protein
VRGGLPQSGLPLVLPFGARWRRPDHSTVSKNRHGRFRESDLLRKLFETVVERCIKEAIVGGEAFAVDASMIVADAHRRRGIARIEDLDPASCATSVVLDARKVSQIAGSVGMLYQRNMTQCASSRLSKAVFMPFPCRFQFFAPVLSRRIMAKY